MDLMSIQVFGTLRIIFGYISYVDPALKRPPAIIQPVPPKPKRKKAPKRLKERIQRQLEATDSPSSHRPESEHKENADPSNISMSSTDSSRSRRRRYGLPQVSSTGKKMWGRRVDHHEKNMQEILGL